MYTNIKKSLLPNTIFGIVDAIRDAAESLPG